MEKFVGFFKKTFAKENMKKFFYSFIWLSVVVFVADIVSKWAVINHFGPESAGHSGEVVVIKNFFYIIFTTNEGAAWSIGSSSRVLWIIVSVVLSAGLIAYFVKKMKTMTKWVRAAFALMIAGAVGNMIDRCFYWEKTVGFSGVVDWLSFTLPTGVFPTFNIADAALVVGVAILIVLLAIELIKDALKKSANEEAQLKMKNHQQNVDENEKSPAIPGSNSDSEETEKDLK